MGLLDFLRGRSREERQRDAFVRKVRTALNSAGVRDGTYDEAEFRFVFPNGRTFFLGNCFADHEASPPNARDQVVARYVASMRETIEIPPDFASARDRLMPSLRDPSMFSALRLYDRAHGRPPGSTQTTAHRSLVEGMDLCIAYDGEESLMLLPEGQFESWGVPFDESLREALGNLRDRTDSEGMEAVRPGLFSSRWNDAYDSSRMLLHDFIFRLPLHGRPVAFAPNRNSLWVTGENDTEGIATMLEQGKGALLQAGHALSPHIYLLTDNGWHPCVPSDPSTRSAWRDVARLSNAQTYAHQKDDLDAALKAEQQDVFVASLQVFRRQDGSEFSATTWTRGVDTYLPKAEELIFVVDHSIKDFFPVPWDAAYPLVESLMERDPALYPLRWRVRDFPDDTLVARLRQLSQS